MDPVLDAKSYVTNNRFNSRLVDNGLEPSVDMRKWSAPLRSENVLVSRSESKSTGDISVSDTFSNQESLVSKDSVQVLKSGLKEIKN